MPIIEELRSAGIISLRGIATALNARGVQTARGGQWDPTTVKRILAR
jgi:Recombinase